jgi:hypothetical protein
MRIHAVHRSKISVRLRVAIVVGADAVERLDGVVGAALPPADLSERDECPGVVGLRGGPGNGILFGVGNFGLPDLGADERGVRALGVWPGLALVGVERLGLGVVAVRHGNVPGRHGRGADMAVESARGKEDTGEAEHGCCAKKN